MYKPHREDTLIRMKTLKALRRALGHDVDGQSLWWKTANRNKPALHADGVI